ncbi:MAG: NAD(P)/FAD-dependent oxidoreductase [Ardenticatenaceae bacterium]|nr:NAD(P)/FAD-dependent oxidoreductase [Anaerolineales bacterium]MCB8938391.1 NAD(P)/FAD-dependent oxidoreductase [Ardenticatenaceae bacterium]MCB8975299.1 NAD(P)/FAD-dependent oxidoreductase [Ardenticatenaceae bacterium]
MTNVIIIGDGPGGLSCALFLAKKGIATTVFGQEKTAMHYAELHNYLGIPKVSGSDFMAVARQQVTDFGAKLANALVTEVTQTDDGFTVTTEDGATHTAKYVVLAEGKGVKLNQSLGLSKEGRSVEVDRNGRTAVSGLYTVGRSTKMNRSQAIISAGEGASAALDILSTEAGKDVLDYDSPPKE